jgi:glycosyltransferase involved in cell wall biosynthesis
VGKKEFEVEVKKKLAFVIATNVIGGHEFQASYLVKKYKLEHDVDVYLNDDKLLPIFSELSEVNVYVCQGLFFQPGNVLIQCIRGLFGRRVRNKLSGYSRVIVCAGAIEAGMQVGLSLFLRDKISLYIPFLYDRRVLWGNIGCIYNLLFFPLLNLFDDIITINKIQARLIKSWYYRGEVAVARNYIKPVSQLKDKGGAPRLVVIARLDRQKCVPELIDSLDVEGNPIKKLLVIGDGPERELVSEKIKLLKYIDVKVLGWMGVDEQSALLSTQDILIVNSVIEGEPMVIREANLRGMTVFAKDIPGVRGVTKKKNRFIDGKGLIKLLKFQAEQCC